jgi:hypothetical protein
MGAGVLEELLYSQPWPAILACGRGIHDDARRSVVQSSAKIAAEAGIGGSRRESEAAARKEAVEPGLDLVPAFHIR